MSQNSLIIFLAIAISCVGAVFKLRRLSIQRRNLELRAKENIELQEFTLDRLDSIGRLLVATDISAEEFERQANVLIAELDSRNISGNLAAVIADVKGAISTELSKRQGA